MWKTIKLDISELSSDELYALRGQLNNLIDEKEQEEILNNINEQVEHDTSVLQEIFPLDFQLSIYKSEDLGNRGAKAFSYSASGKSSDGLVNFEFKCSKNIAQFGEIRTYCSIGLIFSEYDERIYIPYNKALNSNEKIELGTLKKEHVLETLDSLLTDIEDHIHECKRAVGAIVSLYNELVISDKKGIN